MRYRIKICGITHVDQARWAVEAGADALGFVFHAASPRSIAPGHARQIAADLPPFVTTVGLFMNPEPAWVHAVLAVFPPDLLQFHGQEPAAFCTGFGIPYLKALALGSPAGDCPDPRPEFARHPQARGFLLDGHVRGGMGGSGQRFAWERLPGPLPVPWLLAGGLTPENVGEALRATDPYGVDVSSGVESAPGQKDPQRMAAFVAAVRQAADLRSRPSVLHSAGASYPTQAS